MKTLALTISGLLSLGAYADCVLPDGSKIPEGKEGQVSLFNPGKVLEKQPVIDQDGLGVCFSTAPAISLKTVLPGNPDLSYHYAAMVGSSEAVKGKLSKYEAIGKDKANFMESGLVCDAIHAMKKKGGYCPKEFSKLEDHELSDPNLQAFAQRGLGRYFDSVNLFLTNDEEKIAELKAGIAEAVKIIESGKGKNFACTEDYFPSEEALKNLMTMTLFDEAAHPCRERLLALKELNDPGATFKLLEKYELKPTLEVRKKFQAIFKSDPDLSRRFNEFIKTKDKPDPALARDFGKRLNAVLDELFPPRQFAQCKRVIEDGSHPLLTLGGPISAEFFLVKMRSEKNRNCKTFADRQNARAKAEAECAYSQIGLVMDAVHPLVALGEKAYADQLFELLANPVAKEAKQIQDILMPGCAANLKSLPITCQNVTMCEHSALSGFNKGKYTGPKGKCHGPEAAKKLFASQAIDSVKANEALSISICTGFFKGEGQKSNYCKTRPGTGKHKFHSLVVSGYRCQGGKLEYELLNSWGKDCPASKTIDCVKEEDGKTNTGRFWVKEDELVDNTMAIHALRKDP